MAEVMIEPNRCHSQTLITAGTIFHSSNLPLTKWFLAMYMITQSKNGISALKLSRQIGASYNATWRLKHKLMQVMLERGSEKRIGGRIEIDDSYLGGGLDHNCGHNVVRTVPAVSGFSSTIRGDAGAMKHEAKAQKLGKPQTVCAS